MGANLVVCGVCFLCKGIIAFTPHLVFLCLTFCRCHRVTATVSVVRLFFAMLCSVSTFAPFFCSSFCSAWKKCPLMPVFSGLAFRVNGWTLWHDHRKRIRLRYRIDRCKIEIKNCLWKLCKEIFVNAKVKKYISCLWLCSSGPLNHMLCEKPCAGFWG